jgi:hypothetical protein
MAEFRREIDSLGEVRVPADSCGARKRSVRSSISALATT